MYPLPFPEPYWFRKLWVPSFADSGLQWALPSQTASQSSPGPCPGQTANPISMGSATPGDAVPWLPIQETTILLSLRLIFLASALLRSMEPLQYSVGIIEDTNTKCEGIIKSSTYKAARSPVEPFCQMLCKLTPQNPSKGFQGLLRPSAHQYK